MNSKNTLVSEYYELWKHMSDEHGLTLTETELRDIIDVVAKEDELGDKTDTLTIADGYEAKPGDKVWDQEGRGFIVMLGTQWFFQDFKQGNLWSEIRHENLYPYDPTSR